MFLDLLDDPDIESVFAKVAKFNEHKEWDDPRNTTLPNLEVFDRGLNKSGAHSIGIRLSEDGTVTFKVTR